MARDPYSTHLPALCACLARVEGPVLEQGIGLYSTPVLHALCAATRRPLVSIDGDEKWLARFACYATAWHTFRCVSMPSHAVDLVGVPWGVVLVDGAVIERVPWIEAVRRTAVCIVVHDTQASGSYGFEGVLPTFRYRVNCTGAGLRIFKELIPETTVVSDVAPLDWLRGAAL